MEEGRIVGGAIGLVGIEHLSYYSSFDSFIEDKMLQIVSIIFRVVQKVEQQC